MQTPFSGVTPAEVEKALDRITGGRIPPAGTPKKAGAHPFILERSSGLEGKSVLETPGLVAGDPDKPICSVGVGMTLTENMIELAGAMGLDALIVHHPVADAASSGGVPLKGYLSLYGLALFELHEPFHGLHPGIAYLHGHEVTDFHHAFAGVVGNIVLSGRALPGVCRAEDIIRRLNAFMGYETEQQVLGAKARICSCHTMETSSLLPCPEILSGSPAACVNHILHVFPHTGFTRDHLVRALDLYPDTDTLVVSISRVSKDSQLAAEVRKRGLTLIAGNSHSQEIYENGVPLAMALGHELPGLRLEMFKERMTAVPLEQFGNEQIRNYGREMAKRITGWKNIKPKE